MRGYIWSQRLPWPVRSQWPRPLAAPHWMDPASGTFTPRLLDRCHRMGKPVLARDLAVGIDLERLVAMGLDAVVTDCPEVLAKQKAGPRSDGKAT